jgi:hypothetical protein
MATASLKNTHGRYTEMAFFFKFYAHFEDAAFTGVQSLAMMVLQVFLFSYRGNITLFSARFKTLGPFP